MPQKIDKSDCSAKLFAIRDALHVLLGDLGDSPVQAGQKLFPVAKIHEVAAHLLKATELVNDCAPDLKGEIQETEGESYLEWVGTHTDAFHNWAVKLPKAQETVAVPVGVAADILADKLNSVTNLIHQVATALALVQKKLKGCDIVSLPPGAGAEVAAYCSGVILKALSGPAQVMEAKGETMVIGGQKKDWAYPVRIQHPLGIHGVDIFFKEGDPGKYRTIVRYREGYKSSWAASGGHGRLDGVREKMAELGLGCATAGVPAGPVGPGSLLPCWGQLTLEQIRQVAAFFSLLRDLDMASKPYPHVEIARDAVWDLATGLVDKYGEDTYLAPQGTPNWSALLQSWNQKKQQLQLQGPLEALVKFARHRDRHHELEENLYLKKPVPKNAVALIVKNAEDTLKLLQQQGWSTAGLAGPLAALKAYDHPLTPGEAHKLHETGSPSDMVGHNMHQLLMHQLSAWWKGQGSLGKCLSYGSLGDSNAGMVAYCTRILGSGKVTEQGSTVEHGFPPHQVRVDMKDEQPGGMDLPTGLYRLSVMTSQLPADLRSLVEAQLKGRGYDAAPTFMAKLAGLEEVTWLGSFLSHLQGTGALGEPCLGKAVAEAAERAQADQGKGVLAFLGSPRFAGPQELKAWCQKQGVSVATTPEEKAVEKEVKGASTYAGCLLETVPSNKGELAYCSGVMRNPESDRNAVVTPSGTFHYYHKAKNGDLVGLVKVAPEKGELFSVLVDLAEMYGEAARPHVIALLQAGGWSCVGAQCQGKAKEFDLRALAAFLSKLHHAYDVPDACQPAAVNFAWEHAAGMAKSHGAETFSKVAYPYTLADWDKEVCSQLKPGAVPPAPPPIKAVPEAPPALPGKPKIPYKLAGCTVHTAKVVTNTQKYYCQGVKQEATIWPVGKLHTVGVQPVVWDTKFGQVILTIPEAWQKIDPLVKHLTKMASAVQSPGTFTLSHGKWGARRLAVFLSNLANLEKLPQDCWAKAVHFADWKAGEEYVLTAAWEEPLYPKSVEEWQKEICQPETVVMKEVKPPPAPGVPTVVHPSEGNCIYDTPELMEKATLEQKAMCRGVRIPLYGQVQDKNGIPKLVVLGTDGTILFDSGPKAFIAYLPVLGWAPGVEHFLETIPSLYACKQTVGQVSCLFAEAPDALLGVDLARVALFLSDMDSVDLVNPECLDFVLKKAQERAQAESGMEEPWTSLRYTSEDWNQLCEAEKGAAPLAPTGLPIIITPTEGFAPLTVKVVVGQIAPFGTVDIGWGDGDTSGPAKSGDVIVHTYMKPGEYELEVLDIGWVQPILVSGPEEAPPTATLEHEAVLSAENMQGPAPLKVSFQANVTKGPQVWTPAAGFYFHLDFGDGAVQTNTIPFSIAHIYDKPGEYTVQLTVSWAGGGDAKKAYILVGAPEAKPPKAPKPTVKPMGPVTPLPKAEPPVKPVPVVKGCSVIKGVESINEGVRTYCSGLYRHPTKGKSGIITGAASLINYMDTCRVEAQLMPQPGNTVQVSLALKESTVMKTPNWKARQEAVSKALVENALMAECHVSPGNPQHLLCSTGKAATDKAALAPADVKLLATFLSSMGNVDRVKEAECVPHLVRYAYQQALEDQELEDITAKVMSPYEMVEWEQLCAKLMVEEKP